MGIDKFNHEGYSDPTTYEALTNIHREEMAADKKAAYLPLVYVCSPYAGDIENNVKNAKAYSRYAVKENAIPVTPHLLYPQFMDDGNDAEREMAMHFNYVLLGKCTELWVFGGVVSRGMAREIGVAKKRRMKIRWFDDAMKEVNEYVYRYYFEGKSLIDAAKEAGFKMNHASVKRMLSNKKYLGTDYYPQIIDEETQTRFLEELTRRAGNLGRLDRRCKEHNKTVPTAFHFKPADLTFPDPFEQAE